MSTAIQNQYNSAFSASSSLVGKGDELDKEAFLMLMVTQFQYQDPLNPSEDTDYVAQLAQFSSLEQMMNMNESMNSMVDSQNRQIAINAASFIGKEVVAQGYGISITDGVASKVNYGSDEDIASGVVNIFDANNEMVASVKLEATSAGVHEFEWDGRLADGTIAPNGVYSFAISAQDANGDTVLTQAQVSGLVTAVSNYEGVQFLMLEDGRVVSLDEVTEILAPGAYDDKTEDTETDGSGETGETDNSDTSGETAESGDTTDSTTDQDASTAETIANNVQDAADAVNQAVADIPTAVSETTAAAKSAGEEFLAKTPAEMINEVMSSFTN